VALRLHRVRPVRASENARNERRDAGNTDRRKHSRSGRRAGDPHTTRRWQRLAWVCAAYGAFIGLRFIPSAIRRLFAPRSEV